MNICKLTIICEVDITIHLAVKTTNAVSLDSNLNRNMPMKVVAIVIRKLLDKSITIY